MAPCFLLMSVLLFSGLSPPQDLNSDQGHFSCRLRRRRPPHGWDTHTIWDHFFRGDCTYGAMQKISTTFSLRQVRREYVRKLSPLQIVCSAIGSRSVITAVVTSPRITLHLGHGLRSVIFDTKDKPVQMDCQKPQFTSLECCYKPGFSDHRNPHILSARNIELPFETQVGANLEQDNRKEKKTATTFTTSLIRKHFGKLQSDNRPSKSALDLEKDAVPVSTPLFLRTHKTAKMKKKNIFAAALKTNFIKLKSGPKMQHIHRNTQGNVQVQADGLNSRHTKVQNVKTMFLIEKPVSKSDSIKVMTLKSMARKVQKGSTNSMAEVAEASTQVGRQSVKVGYNIKNKASLSQNIKDAAANPEIKQTTVIMKAFDDNKWAAQRQTRNKMEREADPELRFVTKKQTAKPHSAFQMAGLRMREEPLHDERVEGEERNFTDSQSWESFTKQGVDKTVVDKPPCQGLIHQTEAGLKHCKDRLEKSNKTSMRGLPGGREAQRFPNDDNTENSHFYYFDGILKRVENSPQNKKQSM